MKTIAVYDVNWHGHHPMYLRLVTKILLESGCNVWLFCQNSEEVKQWVLSNTDNKKCRITNVDIKPKYQTRFVLKLFSGIINWVYAAKKIKSLVIKTRSKPDFVFFLKVEDLNRGIVPGFFVDLVFPYSWSGLFIHLSFPGFFIHLFLSKYFCQPFSIFSAKNCNTVAIFQEDSIAKFKHIINRNIVLFPDITDDEAPEITPLINTIKKKTNGRTIVGLIGGQDRRKGSFTMLNVAQKAKRNDDFYFVWAGKMNFYKSDKELEALKNIIGNKSELENCFFHFEHIDSESEFNALINTSDIIFAVYNNFNFSSNIMTKAALFNKPILVSTGSLMSKRVKKFKTGLSCDVSNNDNILSTMYKLSSMKFQSQNFQEYCCNHSMVRFEKKIRQIINNHCGNV